MFASELAKPTSICLGAFEGDLLVGYAINSRYVDAWHVMNVAVDPDHQGRGIARQLLERLFELTADDQRRGYTLEVRVSNADRDPPLRAGRLRAARHPPRLLRRQPGGRADHVARRQAADVILGIETSCDETAAALVTARRRDPGERRRLAGRAARAVRRRRPRDREPPPPRARHPRRSSRRSPTPSATLDDVELVAVTSRPGPDRRAARRRLSAAKALAWARRLPLVARQPPARPRRLALPASRSTSSRRSPACSRAAATRCCSTSSERGGVPRARDDARRRGRRGVRQGRAPARARLPRRPGDRRARRPGRPRGVRLPRRAGSRASTSRSPGSRRRCSTPSATFPPAELEHRRADLAASYQRAIVRALVERDRGRRARPDRGRRRCRGQLRASRGAAARGARAARALHRQRRDDRLGRPLHRAPSHTPSTFRSMPTRRPVERCWRSARRRSPSRSRSSGALRSDHGPAKLVVPAASWRGLVGATPTPVAQRAAGDRRAEGAVARRPGRRGRRPRDRGAGARVDGGRLRRADAAAHVARARRASPSSPTTPTRAC